MASGAPESSTIRFSVRRYSWSRMSRAPRRTPSLWRSSPFSLREFPSKSRTHQPGVSSLNRWSWAKRLTPWKCLKTSCAPCFNTETSLRQMPQKKRLGLPAASVAPVMKNRPTSSAPHTFFILYVRLDRTLRRRWLASDSSALLSLLLATCGPEGAALCPKSGRTASNSVNEKLSEERKDTKAIKYLVKHLLPMSGSKTNAPSSAQIERHSVNNWCPVA